MTKQSTQTKIEDLLRLTSLPDFSKVKDNPDIMEPVASSLYAIPESEILTVNFLDTVWTSNTRKYEVLFQNGSTETFYYKKCSESALSEAVGWNLSNILLSENKDLIVGKSETGSWNCGYVAMQDLGENLNLFNGIEKDGSHDYISSLELAKTLSLTDRHNFNFVMSKDLKIKNVDYESIFSKNEFSNADHFIEQIVLDKELLSQKQFDARQIMAKNFQENESLITELIVYFLEESGSRGINDENYVQDPLAHMKLYLGVLK